MTAVINFLVQHQAIAGAAAVWIFSALVSSMPAPTVKSGSGYVWLYKFLQTIGGSLKQINLIKADDTDIRIISPVETTAQPAAETVPDPKGTQAK